MTLDLDGVSAGYAGVPVLRDVSISVPDGKIVALLGPNGAGKTTLLRVASGLIAPTAGEIRFHDVTLTGKPADAFARSGICHIPEGRGVFTTMSVRDNLLLQAPRGEEQEALDRACEAFPRLGERLDQRAGTLSGGEQQFLAVARAYIAHPDVVLLDEVSLGLAPLVVDQIFAFFGRIASTGASLLLVEQYVTRALKIADYVYVLNHGRIMWSGEPGGLDAEELIHTYIGDVS